LAVDVAADGHRAAHGLHVRLLREDLLGLITSSKRGFYLLAEPLDLVLRDRLEVSELLYLLVKQGNVLVV